ncbi:MAG: triose-phosphate isomerase [Alphaproteobacteria bacterium]
MHCDVLLCPPATMQRAIAERVRSSAVAIGGQDCHAKDSGAYTGDISATMLKDAGAKYVLVGHSERRQYHKETDADVRAKAEAAHKAGLIPLVCIGETLAERDGGQTLSVVERQLAGSLPPGLSAEQMVVAYEPVWAIGTGRTPKQGDVAEVHRFIRAKLNGAFKDGAKFRILYGGSANAANAAELLAADDVNGLLVGGASLKADEFWQMIETAR